MTPFDPGAPRRLHPVSVLFNLASVLKAIALPLVFVLFGSRSGEAIWAVLPALVLIPVAIAAAVGYLRFTYTYGDDELIIRSGIFVKRERHIPYARIQNIDATQNIAHALFGVYVVALETGGGGEAEATLKVLPEQALNEMRRHVFQGRRAAEAAGETSADPPEPIEVLLRLTLRDLVTCGLVRGRGLLLLGALASAAVELGLDDAAVKTAEDPEASGPIANAVRAVIQSWSFDLFQVLAAVLLFTALVLLLRLFSVIYTVLKLHGFSLVHASGELRMTYGLLTRVRATIPLRRIQAVTIREGPLHRLFGVSSVHVDTAGGEANQKIAGSREWVAPIIARRDMGAFVRRLIADAQIEDAAWVPPHPRAARRAFVRASLWPVLLTAGLFWYSGAWSFPVLVIGVGLALLWARMQVRWLGYRLTEAVFMFRSGWIWRHVTIAPLDKVQAVAVHRTPFDRRHGMSSLVVDTAGASGAPHRLDVPYLDAAAAARLAGAIGARAAGSALSW